MAYAPTINISWHGDEELIESMGATDERIKKVITGEFMYHSGEATKYAKEHAPWTDRTGNARSGLHSGVDVGDNFWELYVAHSVFYGIYLETRWSGKYQILAPTILHIGKQLMDRLNGALAKIHAGSVSIDE